MTPSNKPKTPIRVFQLNKDLAEFEELDIPEGYNLQELLDSTKVLFFVDADKYRSFIWTGAEVSTRSKFIAAEQAGGVRDKIGPAIKVSTQTEGDEGTPFKIMVGLEEAQVLTEEDQTGPAYEGREQDDELLQELTREKIVLLLEKIGCPKGYTRELVIDGRTVYGYHEIYREYMGEIIKERRLYPLEDTIPDGPYFAKGLEPRILMSYNKVVVTEFLRKLTPEEKEEEQETERKMLEANAPETPFVN